MSWGCIRYGWWLEGRAEAMLERRRDDNGMDDGTRDGECDESEPGENGGVRDDSKYPNEAASVERPDRGWANEGDNNGEVWFCNMLCDMLCAKVGRPLTLSSLAAPLSAAFFASSLTFARLF